MTTVDKLTVEAVHPALPALLEWLTQQEDDEGRLCLDGNVARAFLAGWNARSAHPEDTSDAGPERQPRDADEGRATGNGVRT